METLSKNVPSFFFNEKNEKIKHEKEFNKEFESNLSKRDFCERLIFEDCNSSLGKFDQEQQFYLDLIAERFL